MNNKKQTIAVNEDVAWGAVATLLFTVAIYVIAFAVLVVVFAAFIIIKSSFDHGGVIDEETINKILGPQGLMDGDAFCAITLLASPIIILLTILAAKLRKGSQFAQYFNIVSVNKGSIALWLGILIVFILFEYGIDHLFSIPIPEFTETLYRTSDYTPLLWLTLIVVAPLSEEISFRGFLYKGLERSKLGHTGAILISTVLWTSIHTQYGWHELSIIFFLGIIFGISRMKTNSLLVPILLHAITNFITIVMVTIQLRP